MIRKPLFIVVVTIIILVSGFAIATYYSKKNNYYDKIREAEKNADIGTVPVENPKTEEESVDIVTAPEENPSFEQRLHAIEPENARTIIDDWQRENVKLFLEQNVLFSFQDIKASGRRVPFSITSEDITWNRPVYSENWHTTFMGGKYSNMANLISYAQRSLFVYSGGLSEGAGLYYGLGFTENWGKPVGSSFNATESFELWVITNKVKEVIQLNDQWLVIVEPQLQGYQTVKIDYSDTDINIEETSEPRGMLFRVFTPDGYELERIVGILPVK